MRRPQSTRLTAVLLALSCAAAAPQVSAQQPVNPVNAAMDKADELYRQGNEAYKQNRLKDAYGFYKEAWGLKKSYDIAGNLGAVELAINLPRDAAEHLLHSLRQFPANGKPEARDKTRQRLEEALKQIGTLTIKANIDGADVLIDGKSVGKAPLDQELFVDPGTRKIEAKMEGYEPVRQQLQVAKGSTHQVALKLKKVIAPPPVTSTPTRPSWVVPTLVTGIAIGATSIGTGIILLSIAGGPSSDADDKLAKLRTTQGTVPCPGTPGSATAAECSAIKDLRSDHDTYHNAGVGTLIIGPLLAGAMIGTVFILGPKRPKTETAVTLAPIASTTGGGLWASGTF